MRGTGGNPDVLRQHARSPLVSAAAPVLAVGVIAMILGARVGAWLSAEPEESSAELVAGQVTRWVIPHSLVGPLELPVLNVGTEPIEVLHAQVGDTVSEGPFEGPRTSTSPLPPGTWVLLPLQVPESCHELDTEAVRLLVRSGDGAPAEIRLPLPSESRALRDQQALACMRGTPPTTGDLVGVWLLDRDFVNESVRLTLRFTENGRYRLDSGGGAFAAPVAESGRYRLTGGTLEFRIQEGARTGCEPGERIQVRGHLLGDGRLRLHFPEYPDDTCSALRDVDQVFSRIAGPDQLPGSRP